ncbi:TPA: plasmid SOS inhibition protein A [Klebsiella aerogenes]|uniref:plasmid SOS inhibition protein A n=1 Tax=Klebsiella aerogenes TaxID=548 RepID=UPI0005ED6E7C|nr:plasmid SOS inhibition protein A [Klebsiella aerogenes]ELI7173125.1 plasmid SOS inhibition protein A [Klebsiella aerogenes]EME8857328.1 plasmid SOS inhibition protein A [Klebsiella aerogenes]KJL81279.1 psiA family protein [Klebsiella aerogenes]KZQ03423.1 psiA family protein [Klebsiella aerogenes]RNT20898.1 plasmid SOS inhibition protein A [Klebsiella aerogenes]
MIPANLSLVPFSPERRAAMEAIAEVERRRSRGAVSTMYPYASAFFRRLTGSTRISLREIHHFAPVLTARELRGCRDSWLSAIDALIESRGTCCWLPLPVGAGQHLFPEVAFQQTERVRCQDALRDEKYTRQRHKERCQREQAYQALAGQAEIELAFHTPETVSSWSARWSGSELRQYDLEEMFWRWSERFPSLSGLDHWMFEGEPFWTVMAETKVLARESPESVRQLERWMVPNKLTMWDRA